MEEELKIYRKRITEKLNDLFSKIEDNESLPESEQDIDFLIQIEDKIDECLNNWNY